MKTKYRIIYDKDGIVQYLQYQENDIWKNILDARFHLNKIFDYPEYNAYVSSINYRDLKQFAKDYPNIEDWYIKRNEMIKEEEAKYKARWEKYEQNKTKVDYL